MRNFGQSVGSALAALGHYKLRAALTLVGMLIGVAGLLIIDAFGQTARAATAGVFGAAATLVTVEYSAPSSNGTFTGGGQSTLTPQDAQAVQRMPHVVAASPMLAGRFDMVAGAKNWNSMVWGAGPAIQSLQQVTLSRGRFFTQQEDSSSAAVVVLSNRAAANLFGATTDGLGQQVRIGGAEYQVVGVLQPQGMTPAGHDMDEIVYVPLGASQQRLFGQPFSSIILQVDAAPNVPGVMSAITQTLSQSHRLGTARAADFTVKSAQQNLQEANEALGAINLVMNLIAGVALLIGGIGIANIMFAAVTERRREIGIRMAVGARQQDVLLQFLLEASTLSVLGAVLGVGLGFGLWWLAINGMPMLAAFGVWPSPAAILLALLLALALGLLFGVLPARRAARLDPAEALRRA
jgi:putative ABC transport system permease protein